MVFGYITGVRIHAKRSEKALTYNSNGAMIILISMICSSLLFAWVIIEWMMGLALPKKCDNCKRRDPLFQQGDIVSVWRGDDVFIEVVELDCIDQEMLDVHGLRYWNGYEIDILDGDEVKVPLGFSVSEDSLLFIRRPHV